jgi:hypothetical protein
VFLLIYNAHLKYIDIVSGKMRWAGYVACMGERGGAGRVLVRKLDEKR